MRDYRLIYEKIREITKKIGVSGRAIKDKDGKVLMETEEIKDRWEEYITELFEDDRREEEEENSRPLNGERRMDEEVVEYAMRKMKKGESSWRRWGHSGDVGRPGRIHNKEHYSSG